MRTKFTQLEKTLTIIITFMFLNISLLTGVQNCTATSLLNENLIPEKDFYWVYERIDYIDYSKNNIDYVYQYNISFKKDKIIKVQNKPVVVLELEGTGKIVKWSPDVLATENNSIYIKKVINKENMELIKYTQYITLSYVKDNQQFINYHHENITYNYTKLNKPSEIEILDNWTKRVIRTQDWQYRYFNETEDWNVHQEEINSTIFCDRIEKIKVPAGEFNTFVIIEWQYIGEVKDTTIEYYYAEEVNGFVKKVRKNIADEIVETEELLEFGIPKDVPDNNVSSNGENDNDESNGLLDLNDRNVQILIGVICIFIAIVIIGYVSYKQRH